jgi:hypothetical protein
LTQPSPRSGITSGSDPMDDADGAHDATGVFDENAQAVWQVAVAH